MPKTDLEWLMSQFHQDWRLQFETWQELVDHWVEVSSPARCAAAASQLADLLTSTESDPELDRELDRMGCDYYAGGEFGGYRGWLTAVHGRLRDHRP